MTKNFKRFLSAVLALVMTFAVCSFNVMAVEGDGTGTGEPVATTISFNNTAEQHTYKIYQILKGDVGENNKLENVQWGSSAPESIKSDNDSAGTYAAAVATTNNAEATAKELVAATLGAAVAEVTGAKADGATEYSYAVTTVDPGYYLIIDDTTNPLTGEAYSAYIVEVVDTVIVTPKTSVPTVTKKVKDTNDSTGETTDWQDSADYDIGDTVPFQLTATLGTDVAQYEKYYLQFVDTISAGLTLAEDFTTNGVTVKIGGTEVTTGYTVALTDNGFTVTFDDLKAIEGVTVDDGTVITVDYSATLNTDANVGQTGNPNDVVLKFQNNPYWDGTGTPSTGETPKDTVIVFTYKTVVTKIDGATEEELKGADFALYKITGVTADNAESIKTAKVTYTAGAEGAAGTASITASDGSTISGIGLTGVALTTNADKTVFTGTGLDDGYYVLIETKTPAGYNAIDPQIYQVTASHDVEADAPQLTALNGDVVSGTITFTPTLTNDEAKLNTSVVNNSGSTLPETGGMGTKIFYTLGGILVIGAGILLITKRRMKNV